MPRIFDNIDQHLLPALRQTLDVSDKLTEDLKRNSTNRVMRFKHDTLTVQCIQPKSSKPILDRIDNILAQYYGLNEAELDFIVNYDIKYRLGRDADEDSA